jgi:hypothetical protein
MNTDPHQDTSLINELLNLRLKCAGGQSEGVTVTVIHWLKVDANVNCPAKMPDHEPDRQICLGNSLCPGVKLLEDHWFLGLAELLQHGWKHYC